jgi:hypothetical protein
MKAHGTHQNMLTHGREATVPLDIMFSLPEHAKPVSITEWVCDLRQKLEDAHEHARISTKSAMLRQTNLTILNCLTNNVRQETKFICISLNARLVYRLS